MNEEAKTKAIKMITESNSCKASFRVPVNDNYSNVHEILIHESNATLIRDLVLSGYSLFMTPKGLSVTKI